MNTDKNAIFASTHRDHTLSHKRMTT